MAAAVWRLDHVRIGTAGYEQKKHRSSLVAPERAARLRGCCKARQFHRRRPCIADFAERAVAPCHSARAAGRSTTFRPQAARAVTHEGRPTSAPGGGQVI